ncbi:DUF1127 domain-containing protein [Pseudovibrio flavus]|uniref:DUF1127 domain-containing protein n=1 Tax=Pseudovibrio flavus TaxID=2529854 RepID=UPI00211D06AE|nr:DUF1127 domain-containing protein [Pseudovibrio flavus]
MNEVTIKTIAGATNSAGFSDSSPLRHILSAFRKWRNRRAIQRLARLDDRILHDIGVTRGDVMSALSTSRSCDASLDLAARAEERKLARKATRSIRV